MEKQRPLPNTIKEAAFNYHKGNFEAFKNWIEVHKRDNGRFTEVDALNVKREVAWLIMEDANITISALEFQMDPMITPYETGEIPSS